MRKIIYGMRYKKESGSSVRIMLRKDLFFYIINQTIYVINPDLTFFKKYGVSFYFHKEYSEMQKRTKTFSVKSVNKFLANKFFAR